MTKSRSNSGDYRSGIGMISGLFLLFAALIFVYSKTDVYVDDLFITLSYSQNLIRGNGMVFQNQEHILGTTSPLWCVLNAIALKVGSVLVGEPLIGTRLLFLLVTFMAALALVKLCCVFGAGWFSWLAGVHFILHVEHASLFGYETSLAVCLASIALLGLYHNCPALMGIASALLCMTRPEAAILPVLVLAADCYIRGFRHAGRAFVWFGVIFGISVLLLSMAFTSPIPHTLAAKQAQREQYTWWISVLLGAKNYLVAKFEQEQLVTFLSLVGFATTVKRFALRRPQEFGYRRCSRRRLQPLLVSLWPLLHVSSLTFLGIAFYDWYLYPIWMCISMFVGIGSAQLYSLFRNHNRDRKVATAQAVPILVPAVVFLYLSLQQPWAGDPVIWQRDRYLGYMTLSQAAAIDAKGREAKLWTREIGVLRYFLPQNVQVIDGHYLVRDLPASGIIPSSEKQIAESSPDYIVESLPSSPSDPGKLSEHQEKRMEPDYTYQVRQLDGSSLTYRVIHRIKNQYGIQLLLRKS